MCERVLDPNDATGAVHPADREVPFLIGRLGRRGGRRLRGQGADAHDLRRWRLGGPVQRHGIAGGLDGALEASEVGSPGLERHLGAAGLEAHGRGLDPRDRLQGTADGADAVVAGHPGDRQLDDLGRGRHEWKLRGWHSGGVSPWRAGFNLPSAARDRQVETCPTGGGG